MTQPETRILAAALALTVALTLSCSDDGGTPSKGTVRKEKISGISQKGPFVQGSKATLYELNDQLEQTGRSFTDIIADDKGSFEIRNVELASPYAMLEASGYYRNEVTGLVSAAPITLFAIADVREKDNVNVNILTHLEYYRVLNLVDNEGKSIKDAKKQAQREIFAVFGINSDSFKDSEDMSIFGTSESDAALLAISILLQGDLSEGEFSKRLTSFAQSLKASGTWDNEEEKGKMAYWGMAMTFSKRDSAIQFCKYDNDPNNCWPMPTNDMCRSGLLVDICGNGDISEFVPSAKFIKNNILAWGLSSNIPDFEKYVSNYWIGNYGLGKCDASNENEFKKGFICKNNAWERPTRLDHLLSGTVECAYTVQDLMAEEDYFFVCKENGFWQVLDNPTCEKIYPYEGKPEFVIVCEN